MPSQIPDKGTVKTPGGYDAVVQAVMQVDEQGNYAGGGSGAASSDRELVVTTYIVKNAFSGASVGDTITSTRVLDVSGAIPSTVSVIWRNETTMADLVIAPSGADLTVAGQPGLTDAQLRASPLAIAGGAFGATNDTTASSDTGTFSLLSLFKRHLQKMTSLIALFPASLGAKTSAASFSVVPASDALFGVAGNVASGAADAGNPVKVGGRYAATLPTMLDGQRGDLMQDSRGGLIVSIAQGGQSVSVGSPTDAATNARNALSVFSFGANFDGTVWQRQRGDTTGTYMVGNVGSGVADVGNPVKVGGVASTNPASVTSGQRSDLWLSLNGAAMVSGLGLAGSDGSPNTTLRGIPAVNSTNNGHLIVAPYNFNGTAWDRQRGDVSGIYTAGAVFFTEMITPLAVGASFTGANRNNGGVAGGVGSRFNFFVAEAFTDVAGSTLIVEKSTNGGTSYQIVGSIALSANTSVSLKVPVTAADYRTRLTAQTGSAQTLARLTSAYTTA